MQQQEPAVVGTQFFGGNKQKEEFYDPVAEAAATISTSTSTTDDVDVWSRWEETTAFDPTIVEMIRELQGQLKSIATCSKTEETKGTYTYSPQLQWTSPFRQQRAMKNPLEALREAADFYNDISVGIVSATVDSDGRVRIRWEIGLAWPTVWEPRVVVSGTSQLRLEGTQIVQQVDTLDRPDIMTTLTQQIAPRFWDFYHLGMSPVAEQTPTVPQQQSAAAFSKFIVLDIPPRWSLRVTMVDKGTRQDANAAIVPHHAFSCVIKTMGADKQKFVPTTPVQVQAMQNEQERILQWDIPVSTQFLATRNTWPIPPPNEEEQDASSNTNATYVYVPARRIALIPHGGGPADVSVSKCRQDLYKAVLKEEKHYTVAQEERPQFFYWQQETKACWTEEGLGMVTYEWRPDFIKSNYVGLELEAKGDLK